jgi:hypothetical protein
MLLAFVEKLDSIPSAMKAQVEGRCAIVFLKVVMAKFLSFWGQGSAGSVSGSASGPSLDGCVRSSSSSRKSFLT